MKISHLLHSLALYYCFHLHPKIGFTLKCNIYKIVNNLNAFS